MTVKSRKAAAWRPRNNPCGVNAASGLCRRIRRTSAMGAPSALKLPSAERFDSSLTLICLTPSCFASVGKRHSGVA